MAIAGDIDIEETVFMARVAEQSERFDDMFSFM